MIILLTYYLKLLSPEISKKFEITVMIYDKHPIVQSIYSEPKKTFSFAFPLPSSTKFSPPKITTNKSQVQTLLILANTVRIA